MSVQFNTIDGRQLYLLRIKDIKIKCIISKGILMVYTHEAVYFPEPRFNVNLSQRLNLSNCNNSIYKSLGGLKIQQNIREDVN